MKLTSLTAIARAFAEGGVRYLVAGGMAVVAHGYGRLTYDIDLVIRLNPENILRAFDALSRLGYRPRVPITAAQFADPVLRRQWRTEKGMQVLNLFSDTHRDTPVDLFVEEPFDFEASFERALVEELAKGVPLRIVDLPTLIAMKRSAGRPKDIDDVAHLERILEDEQA